MLVMVVFFIAFRWIHLSTPLIRLFLLVLILLLMPTLNFLPVWFALSLLRFRLPSRLPKIGRAVQQECRDRTRMPSSAGKKKLAARPWVDCVSPLGQLHTDLIRICSIAFSPALARAGPGPLCRRP